MNAAYHYATLPTSALTLLVWQQEGHLVCKKLSGGVLVWLSVWRLVQTCIWPSRCHCHSLSLASVKSRLVFTFLVPAHLGDPRQRAIKRVSVCVCSHSMWSRVGVTAEHPSVSLSHRSTAAASHGRFAVECPEGRRYQSLAGASAYQWWHAIMALSSKCRQCHVLVLRYFIASY